MAGDEERGDTLPTKIANLETQLAQAKQELELSQQEVEKGIKTVNKLQRQLEKSNSYNEDLCQQIVTLSREIQELRDKKRDVQDIAVQAMFEEIVAETGDKPLPEWEKAATTAADGSESVDQSASIAESLKQTAEETLAQSGFVFDDNTGLYYDYNSGYYYNCEEGLYYDPGTGTYFYYDESSGEYKFHSQVAPQQYSCPTHTTKGDNSSRKTGHGVKEKKKEKRKNGGETKERKRKKRKRKTEDREDSDSRRKLKQKRKEVKNEKQKDQNSLEISVDSQTCRVFDSDESHHKDGKESFEKESAFNRKFKTNPDKISDHLDCDSSMKSSENVPANHRDCEDDEDGLSEGEVLSDSVCSGGSELESGEITPDSESDSSDSPEESEEEEEEDIDDMMESLETVEEMEEVSGSWPPCVRVMVTESDCVSVGTLFIIPCTGGTIGREKNMNHLIRIPDINISKLHAQIHYDYNLQSYVIVDAGSQNGTYLNGARISQTKSESDGHVLSHNDVLLVGNTELLIHIHPGSDTCDDCEPGQVLARLQAQEKANTQVVIKSKSERLKEQRQQLKQIKKKYGLENCAYVDDKQSITNPAYTDKASVRRRDVGSDNPYAPDEAPASVMKPISTQNKGHKLLAKMGWKEGQGLGKDSTGIAEPINVTLRSNQAAGLGSGLALAKNLDDVHSTNKSQRWLQAQKRYSNLDAKPVDLSKPLNMNLTFKKGPTVLQPRVDLEDHDSPAGTADSMDSD